MIRNDNTKIIRQTAADGSKNVEILLKYLSNIWKTLEMSLINCKLYLILTWSAKSVIFNAASIATFAMKGRKPFVPVFKRNGSYYYN